MIEHKVGGSLRRAVRYGDYRGVTLGGLLVVGCLGLALCAACGGDEEEVKYPPQQPPPQQPPPQQGAQPTAQPTATAPAGPQPLDPVTQLALKTQIEERAKTEAKGMKPQGEIFGGTVPAGGQVESPQIMVELGKCYTVIAQGGAGVTEVNVEIQAAQLLPPLQAPVVAVDSTTGPAAAISPCWKNAFGIGFPGKVVVKAIAGQGPVAAQIYMK